MTTPTASVYDHYKAPGEEYTEGVYRVVGTGGGGVTLLRVGDPSGRRVNTGELVSVTHGELDGFEGAENPDGNRPLTETLASVPKTVYWSLWGFVVEAKSHPLPSSVALALVLTGYLGEGTVPAPDSALVALVLVGGFGLAYVGSGRLS